jgi:acetyltransferase-like isoleucine patch superfamily enzyme
MPNLHYVLYPQVDLQPNITIGEFSVIGKPSRPRVPSDHKNSVLPTMDDKVKTVIGRGSILDTHVLVEQGAQIGDNCIVEAHVVIEERVVIGECSFIVHGARICGNSVIGKACVVGGFVAERSKVGDYCRVFGSLIHRQVDPTTPWDDCIEPAPTLEDHVFVAMGATVVGEVHLSNHVYVTAGAVVTKSVPPFHIVYGVNRLLPADKWEGPLSQSVFWR